MLENFTDGANKAINLAKKSARKSKHAYVGCEHLLMGLLQEPSGAASSILHRFEVDENKLQKIIDELPQAPEGTETYGEELSPRVEGILKNAVEEAHSVADMKAGTEFILFAMIKDVESVGTRVLHTMGIDIQKLYQNILRVIGVNEEQYGDLGKNVKSAVDSPNLERVNSMSLVQFGRNLTLQAQDEELDPIIGRECEIERILQVLCRKTKNNPCLIGEPGVGKTAIVEGIAQRIADGEVPDALRSKEVFTLDMASMVAGTKYRGEFEERMKRVLNEVMNDGSIILFIDEIHTMIGAGGAEGALDASNIMKPFLSRGEIQVIGATTVEEYRKHIEKDPALERRFQPILIEEPSEEEAVEILKGLRETYEEHHVVRITDEALEAAVKYSKRYISDRFLPDKAIDLIDEACAGKQIGRYHSLPEIADLRKECNTLQAEMETCLQEKRYDDAKAVFIELDPMQERLMKLEEQTRKRLKAKRKPVTEDDIAKVVSLWTKIPVQKVAEKEGRRLLQLEKTLHRRVIGQEEAVAAVAKAIKRGRAGLKDPNRPVGSFLFLGPTGVGKTELSKALAEAVFGSEQSMIRVDMSEYMEKHSVSKMVGSPPGYVGYDEGGQLSEKVRKHPYSVILFDEIEKAHPDVFNILLQILDEGHVTDAQGRKVDFKNTILIMTSNAGAQSIISPKRLGFGAVDDEKKNYEAMKGNVMEEVRRLFKPEFLNRIDDIIVFHSLNKENIQEIVKLLFDNLAKRALDQMEITLKFRSTVRDHIAEKGFDEKYGARPLRRQIQTEIEDELSEEILAGNVRPHDEVTVTMEKGKVAFRVKHNVEE